MNFSFYLILKLQNQNRVNVILGSSITRHASIAIHSMLKTFSHESEKIKRIILESFQVNGKTSWLFDILWQNRTKPHENFRQIPHHCIPVGDSYESWSPPVGFHLLLALQNTHIKAKRSSFRLKICFILSCDGRQRERMRGGEGKRDAPRNTPTHPHRKREKQNKGG